MSWIEVTLGDAACSVAIVYAKVRRERMVYHEGPSGSIHPVFLCAMGSVRTIETSSELRLRSGAGLGRLGRVVSCGNTE